MTGQSAYGRRPVQPILALLALGVPLFGAPARADEYLDAANRAAEASPGTQPAEEVLFPALLAMEEPPLRVGMGRGELRELITRVAEESRLVEAGIFVREELRRLVDEHVSGRVDHNYRLWLLFNLELWYRHFIAGEQQAELEAWIGRAKAA